MCARISNIRFESASFHNHEHKRVGVSERRQLRTRISPKSNPIVSPPSFRTSTTNRPDESSVFCLHTTHVVNADADVPPGIGCGCSTTPRVRACFAWSIRQAQWAWCPLGPDPGGPQYNSTSSMTVTASLRSSCSDSTSDSVASVVIRRDR